MPIYEYGCPKCGNVYEFMHSMNDKPEYECAQDGEKLEKKISAAAFHFKGGGWYKDLYASAKPGSDAGTSSEGSSKAKGESSSGSGSESKADPKPASSATSTKKES